MKITSNTALAGIITPVFNFKYYIMDFRSTKISISTIIIILTIVVSIFGIGALVVSKGNTTQEQTNEILTVRADDWTYGNKDAQVTLIEYTDFECTACVQYFPVINQIKEEYKDSVYLVIRHYPLSIHPYSTEAAHAAEAAGRQGKFWEMHDELYSTQDYWSGNSDYLNIFIQLASEINLDTTQFLADYNSAEVAARVERDKTEAEKLGLNSTPSFILNGTKISAPSNIASFRQILDAALNK